MTLAHTSGSIKKFRRTPWRFQETFWTPLSQLAPFVSAIISAGTGVKGGTLILENAVFDLRHLNGSLAKHGLQPIEIGTERDWTVEAAGFEETRELLQAALADWLDFAFVPAPKPFVIYADHDEFITFSANSKSNLNSVIHSLQQSGLVISRVPEGH